MRYALYATDDDAIRAQVLDAACAEPGPELFTSLQQPEPGEVVGFYAYLRDQHDRRGVRWWADVSPQTLELLGWTPQRLGALGDEGFAGLRLDYGFSPDDIRAVATATGLPIAVNASTATAQELDALAGVNLVGWHNFYPRPETGLSVESLCAQSELFTSRGFAVAAFIPGEVSRRAPLHLGLPTLECQRSHNAYANTVQVRTLCPGITVCCAEGTLLPQHCVWIAALEHDGVLTLPLAELAPEAEYLLSQNFRVRPEQTGLSQRLEGTRGRAAGVALPAAGLRTRGALYADGPELGRYAGEVHLLTTDRPADPGQRRIGELGAAYRDLAGLLRGGETVRFTRL